MPLALSLDLPKESGVEYTACRLGEERILHPSRTLPDIRTDVALEDGQGTVAYVNEFGELVYVVKLLDLGPSGLFQAKPNSHRAKNRDKDNLNSITRRTHQAASGMAPQRPKSQGSSPFKPLCGRNEPCSSKITSQGSLRVIWIKGNLMSCIKLSACTPNKGVRIYQMTFDPAVTLINVTLVSPQYLLSLYR